MSWTAILTALCLSAISAYLVLIEGWSSWRALLYVGGGGAVIITGLIAIVMFCTPEEERGRFVAGIRHGLNEEWEATVRWLRGK